MRWPTVAVTCATARTLQSRRPLQSRKVLPLLPSSPLPVLLPLPLLPQPPPHRAPIQPARRRHCLTLSPATDRLPFGCVRRPLPPASTFTETRCPPSMQSTSLRLRLTAMVASTVVIITSRRQSLAGRCPSRCPLRSRSSRMSPLSCARLAVTFPAVVR